MYITQHLAEEDSQAQVPLTGECQEISKYRSSMPVAGVQFSVVKLNFMLLCQMNG
jgi:hypothetical protein